MAPTSDLHGEIAGLITFYLIGYVLEHDLGSVRSAETGFLISRDPDVVRAADVAFISKERGAQIADRDKYTPFPPDLAVEVVSFDDLADSLQAKIRDYLEAGVRLLWVIHPQTQQVVVYTTDSQTTLSVGDTLTGGEVLPGFALPLAKLFPTD